MGELMVSVTQARTRESWADICRVVATLGVISIHACGGFIAPFGPLELTRWLHFPNGLDSFARASVPLFVMISGALLLRPGAEPLTLRALVRRVLRVLIPLIVWDVFFLLWVAHFTGQPIDWTIPFVRPAMYHLWFVYMMVGIYLLLPVLQAIFDLVRERPQLQLYLLGVWFVATSLPTLVPMPTVALLQLTGFLGYGAYFVMGAVIAQGRMSKVPSWALALIFAAAVIGTYSLTGHFSRHAGKLVQSAYQYPGPTIFLASISAFALFTRITISDETVAKWLEWVSDRTFFIYFFHVIVVDRLSHSDFTKLLVQSSVPGALGFIVFATFLISLAVAAVVRLVPGTRRILG